MHISSAALMIDGKIISAAPEERFNRIKMSTAFPEKSIEWCLNFAGINWDDLDCIVVPWNPQINVNTAANRWISSMRWRGEMLSNVPINIMKNINETPGSSIEMKWSGKKLFFLNHHECHAALSFFQSPFKKADILTIDGHGEEDTCCIAKGNGNKIEIIKKIKYPHSLGLFYGTFTDFLGFKPDSDEWKVMALSSYSKKINKYDREISKIIKYDKNGFELDLSYFDFYTFDRKKNFFNSKFINLFGKPRLKDHKLQTKHYEIAGAMQRCFEKNTHNLLKISKNLSGEKNIVLSGGAAMNCVMNGKLDNFKFYQDSYISNAPDDSGVSAGATLLAYFTKFKNSRKINEIKENFWGPFYDDDEILRILKNFKLNFKKSNNIYKDAATSLSKGNIIGWFQGRMEFGHRALGNRSILADPRKIEMKDKVNNAIKFRESFRPFAPATLIEHQNSIFIKPDKRNIYFMERAYKIKKTWRKKLKAVCHVDNTGRIQTVDKNVHKKFHKLISEFYKITNVPVILNTSFNLNGEPIVMTPKDAIRTFFSCGLDVLYIGNFVVKKQ